MADVVVNTETKDPKDLMGQGIRAFILQDFNTAVSALGKVCELLQTEHGDDLHDSLAEVYLYYGKALLGLSREEAEPLGDAVPKNESDDDEDDEGVVDSAEPADGDEAAADDKAAGATASAATEAEDADNKQNDAAEKENGSTKEPEIAVAGTANGTEEGDSAADTAEDKTEDEEPSDLQVAWEVLELAKKIFQRQGEKAKKDLAETLIVLGEISLESENFEAAINDIKEGLTIQTSLFGNDSRTLAESHYKLGIAYSTDSQIDEAINSFSHALEYLNNRIASLEKIEEKKTEIEEEIKEIKNLIPDVEEKIADMKSYKDEALKKLVSAVTSQNVSTNVKAAATAPTTAAAGNASTSSSSSSSSAPVNNISHLVKRKRKIDEVVDKNESAEESPAKKTPA